MSIPSIEVTDVQYNRCAFTVKCSYRLWETAEQREALEDLIGKPVGVTNVFAGGMNGYQVLVEYDPQLTHLPGNSREGLIQYVVRCVSPTIVRADRQTVAHPRMRSALGALAVTTTDPIGGCMADPRG